MPIPLEKSEQDFLYVHLAFAVVCIGVMMSGMTFCLFTIVGLQLFLLVAFYNCLVPIVGFLRKHKGWVPMWFFAFILSLLMIFPDWFLVAQLEVLVFPPDGFLQIGGVSLYMAGLWAIPFFTILFLGNRIRSRRSSLEAYLVVALLSALIFGISEQTMWLLPSWYAQNVLMVGHMAVYIFIPEILLGLSTYACYELIREHPHWVKLPAAFFVMILYIGNASFFYFIIERVLFGT
jgi:hypothetical protein